MPCDLVKVGTDIAPRSYGIAMRKDADLDIALWDQIIIDLKESGELERLRNKW